MSYWRMPERLLDEPDELLAWARISLGVARKRASAMGTKGTGFVRKVAPSHKAGQTG